jgi:signal transduction histidine kinase
MSDHPPGIPEPEPVSAPAQAPVTILLVDDDSNNLLALESILESPDYRFVRAQTSDEALLALMQGDYAAIVLDVHMPDLSGIELARLIKQRRRTQSIPILFLTAHYRENEHAVLAYDVGAVDYLTKPVHPSVLRSKVGVFVDLFRKTRALATMNDTLEAEIAERKRAEAALRSANAELEAKNAALEREAEERMLRLKAEAARAEAEAANAAKDRFLAMLSHELRTPLSPVLHTVALLEEEAAQSPELGESLELIRRNVQLEARLIDDLLDLARIRNGKLKLQVEPTEVHDVLRRALEICEPSIAARKLNVEAHFDASTTTLQADPARLQQIFWNLISNAVKFTPEGGAITVTTANTVDGMVRIEFSDTGTGIEPEKLEHVFDAFEQGTPRGSGGLGLGLAICKALAEFHGGTISVRSGGVGQGATFSVHLPVAEIGETTAVPDESADASMPAVPLRLLVVEDHHDTAATLCRLLVRRGYVVEVAHSCAAALEKARKFSFDVLVTDIGLPDGNGVDLFQRLKARSDRADILGVALSGFGMEEDLARSQAAGFAEHLTKPVDFSLLDRCLSQIGHGLHPAR